MGDYPRGDRDGDLVGDKGVIGCWKKYSAKGEGRVYVVSAACRKKRNRTWSRYA